MAALEWYTNKTQRLKNETLKTLIFDIDFISCY